MSGEKGTGTERPALKIGGLIKVTNPARSHFHTQCDFARDDVEPYESEDTEPQALVAGQDAN